jgi:hypothetical protein
VLRKRAMPEVRVQIEKVEGLRLSEQTSENATANYTVNASLSEKERESSFLSLSFELDLSSQPQVGRLLVTGFVTIIGSREEIQALIRQKDEKSIPPILVTIYERVYGLLYVISRDLHIPYPMPEIVALSPSEQKR